MKKLLIAAILLSRCGMNPAFAQPCSGGLVTIADSQIVDATTGLPYNGNFTITQTSNSSAGSCTVRGDQQTLTIAGGAINQSFAPGWYSVRQRAAASALTIQVEWQIPTSGGPYRLTDVPTGVVTTSGNSVAWNSGINFAVVQVGKTVAIGSGSCQIESIQSAIAMTCTSSQGVQAGVAFNAGAIEQQLPSTPLPITISGAQGPQGPQGAPGTSPTGPALEVFATPPSSSGAASLLTLTHAYLTEGAPPSAGTYALCSVNGAIAWGTACAGTLSWRGMGNSQWDGATNSQWIGMAN